MLVHSNRIQRGVILPGVCSPCSELVLQSSRLNFLSFSNISQEKQIAGLAEISRVVSESMQQCMFYLTLSEQKSKFNMYSLRRPSQVLLWSSIKSAAVQVIVGGQRVSWAPASDRLWIVHTWSAGQFPVFSAQLLWAGMGLGMGGITLGHFVRQEPSTWQSS